MSNLNSSAQNRLDFKDPIDKPKALTALGELIKRYEYKLQEYKDPEINIHKCARAIIAISAGSSIKESFKKFIDQFNDTKTCRSKCRIDKFIFSKHRAEVDQYIKSAAQLPTNKFTRGFKKIVENLQLILCDDGRSCSCKMCEKIGDFVITLDSPAEISLEHTDLSFNQLCGIIGRKHQIHPSQAWVIKNTDKTLKNADE